MNKRANLWGQECMSSWMNKWMDGWMNEWMDEQKNWSEKKKSGTKEQIQ